MLLAMINVIYMVGLGVIYIKPANNKQCESSTTDFSKNWCQYLNFIYLINVYNVLNVSIIYFYRPFICLMQR